MQTTPPGRRRPAAATSSFTAAAHNAATASRRQSAAEAFKKEEERIASRASGAFRFRLKTGEECEIILLDHSLDDGHIIKEHTLKTFGADGKEKYDTVLCHADQGLRCEHCNGDTASTVLLLSALVLRSWTDKKGNVHEWSRMLFPIKRSSYADFVKLEDVCTKRHGTMRGMYLLMTRGTEATSAATGKPTLLENGMMFDHLPETELEETYGSDAVIDPQSKKVIRPENIDITPFDYEKLFKTPEQAAAPQRASRPLPGSTEEFETYNADEPAEEDVDAAPQAEEEQPATQTASVGRRRAATAPVVPQEQPAPARRARGAAQPAPAPAAPVARRAAPAPQEQPAPAVRRRRGEPTFSD